MKFIITKRSHKLSDIYDEYKRHRIQYLKERNTLKAKVKLCSNSELENTLKIARGKRQGYLIALILKELNTRGYEKDNDTGSPVDHDRVQPTATDHKDS